MKYIQRFIQHPSTTIYKLLYINSINLKVMDPPVIAHSPFAKYIKSMNTVKQCIRYVETSENTIEIPYHNCNEYDIGPTH
jgi:hypothetical protein